MNRLHSTNLNVHDNWDIIIIGGGATGLGTALDSATRGLKTLLVEQSDFAKGTSSRSTKLVHGGVRYLAQGNINLVKHALKERGLLQQNAKHLVKKQEFIIPCYDWFSVLKYLTGLMLYDLLASKYSFGKSKYLSKAETLIKIPGLKQKGLKGSIKYYDGKFDDARLAVNIAQTAIENGATLINYTKVNGLLKHDDGSIIGIKTEDAITGTKTSYHGRIIINATGVFVDDIIKMVHSDIKKMVRPSQGVHVVLDRSFLNTESALMIPKTSDGRVLFAVPWHKHLLVGTTDTPLNEHSLEPRALKEEVDFILDTASKYLNKQPLEKDILSVFCGLRPLAAPTDNNKSSTKEISRDHKLVVSTKGLLTITGGKWTTYRQMAEETVDLAIKHANLNAKPCSTKTLSIHGSASFNDDHYLNIYGSDRPKIEALINEDPTYKNKLHPEFPHIGAEVVWVIRNEMAETIEDILSRRLRILFIDAHAAKAMSVRVAALLAKELNADKSWELKQIEIFNELADGYLYNQSLIESNNH
ncbi:glycerol-3-phosphate dehydrogenase/oxidase [Pedobacter mucosus]|uniref:glycerol-3-phosphate dehydrogenase/oxidase n=1 Tax=Pedobacter mucosus TaxID=2895286 RepID=UPI001EE4B6FA|nr:glycerol-3-phosphate dehydrogenase/oxidase [Pedobacter mucosus]UKT65756.1 glycerol-3-phosphate dehydrogenase/oxidase [Pedobacter mucosus]